MRITTWSLIVCRSAEEAIQTAQQTLVAIAQHTQGGPL